MEKDITEKTNDVFEQAMIDDGGVIRNVAILSTPISKNNRIYTEKALNDLVTHTENLQAFIRHPSKQEMKEGRDIRDLLGSFVSAHRRNGGVFGDLYVREDFRSLMHDLLRMKTKAGFSINARVLAGKTKVNGEDFEEIQSVEAMRSVDLVDSPAMTHGITEAWKKHNGEKTVEESQKDFIEKITGRREVNEQAKDSFMKKIGRRW